MTVRVRDARPEDAEALHRLYHAAYAEGADPHRPPETALTDSVTDVRAFIEEGLVLVAEDDAGRLVGSVHLRSIVNVRRLAVAPERKGEGLSHRLIEEALARGKRDGFAWAMLDTIPAHPWLPKLYRKHGFVERCLEIFPNGVKWLQFRKQL